eukprot:3221420-Pyramimonas_sp.AAC.1
MRVLVGHYTWTTLIRRDGLSLLQSVYAFIEFAGSAPVALWQSVKRELWAIRSVLPLLRLDIADEWHPQLCCSDASDLGIGVVHRRLDPGRVASIGRTCERWRHRVEGAERARERALHPEALEGPALPRPSVSAVFSGSHEQCYLELSEANFDEVPAGLLKVD